LLPFFPRYSSGGGGVSDAVGLMDQKHVSSNVFLIDRS
jgi:hypothetical protein